jgi:release factor glutamine methyltransferase
MADTIASWLEQSIATLQHAGIETARLDALVLLSDELGQDKSWCLAYSEHKLQRSQVNNLNTKVAQRAQHTPLAYVRGHTEFYGREFEVTRQVLVPRPESEAMIELLKQGVGRRASGVVICDIGTGSGCLAITAKLELPESDVYASDVDPLCLQTARANATNLHADITFLQGDLLQPYALQQTADALLLLANLPYVPTNYPINQAAAHEPKLALFSGKDGLDEYKQLFAQADTLAQKPLYIITESLLPQHTTLTEIASQAGYKLVAEQNLAQMFERD